MLPKSMPPIFMPFLSLPEEPEDAVRVTSTTSPALRPESTWA